MLVSVVEFVILLMIHMFQYAFYFQGQMKQGFLFSMIHVSVNVD